MAICDQNVRLEEILMTAGYIGSAWSVFNVSVHSIVHLTCKFSIKNLTMCCSSANYFNIDKEFSF